MDASALSVLICRAETAMTYVLRDVLHRHDEARSLVRAVYYYDEAGGLPDRDAGTLTVRLGHLDNHSSAAAIRHLSRELTATETAVATARGSYGRV